MAPDRATVIVLDFSITSGTSVLISPIAAVALLIPPMTEGSVIMPLMPVNPTWR